MTVEIKDEWIDAVSDAIFDHFHGEVITPEMAKAAIEAVAQEIYEAGRQAALEQTSRPNRVIVNADGSRTIVMLPSYAFGEPSHVTWQKSVRILPKSPPAGWNDIATAPRDGTVIEIRNDYGIAPWYGIYKWADGRGWVDATDDRKGTADGEFLSWRHYNRTVADYVDPTNGAQMSKSYWRRAAGFPETDNDA